MSIHGHDRLLPIGEFAAATQLTPKALRLYDDQGLLRPATIDASSGYRYYGAHQVANGRLIRALRDMSLSLTQVAQVVEAERGLRELLLREFLLEAESRLARERAAYQSALLMMNSRTVVPSEPIEDITLMSQSVSVWEFSTDRRSFNERFLGSEAEALRTLNALGIQPSADTSCLLLEPLTDEDARLELRVPIESSTLTNAIDVTLRHLPARRCAMVSASACSSREGFTSAIDAIFDWFDRRSVHAFGQPEVLLGRNERSAYAEVRWAFTSGDTTSEK